MEAPKFHPNTPKHLLDGLAPRDKWMYETLSIQSQQNEWMIQRLQNGEVRFDEADEARTEMRKELAAISNRVVAIEKIKDRLSAKWAVVAFVSCCVFGPVGLAFLGAFFLRWFEKTWK